MLQYCINHHSVARVYRHAQWNVSLAIFNICSNARVLELFPHQLSDGCVSIPRRVVQRRLTLIPLYLLNQTESIHEMLQHGVDDRTVDRHHTFQWRLAAVILFLHACADFVSEVLQNDVNQFRLTVSSCPVQQRVAVPIYLINIRHIHGQQLFDVGTLEFQLILVE
ncbi:hypothetical protein V2A60_008201 [Cordyceps javanica]